MSATNREVVFEMTMSDRTQYQLEMWVSMKDDLGSVSDEEYEETIYNLHDFINEETEAVLKRNPTWGFTVPKGKGIYRFYDRRPSFIYRETVVRPSTDS